MRIIGTLFGLLFFTFGSFFLYKFSIAIAFDAYEMRQWQTHHATLLSVKGFENNTQASYQYSINGQQYKNDRVYLADFSDNIGSYHKKTYRRLSHLKNKNEFVKIWYQPDKPQNSIIDRDIRWGLFFLTSVFSSVFIFIGLLVIYASFSSSKNKKFEKPSLSILRKEWNEIKQTNPGFDQDFLSFSQQRIAELEQEFEEQHGVPAKNLSWQTKKEWQNNRIRSDAKTGVIGMWLFAIFWNGISSTVLFALEEELAKGNYAILIALLFPIIGLGMVYYAIKLTREWFRFGVIELELDPFPGSIGGHVGGSFFLKHIQYANIDFEVELQCVYTYMSGSGDNRSRKENIKWHEAGKPKTLNLGDGIDIRFRFDVPESLPEADVEQIDSYHFWRIILRSKDDKIKLEREYNIPVYQTATHSANVHHDISEQVVEAKEIEAEQLQSLFETGELEKTDLTKILRFQDNGSEVRFYYPMFRNKVLTFFALIFGIGFSFAAYMINQDFTNGGFMSVVMLIFSIPFALVGIIGIVAAIYLPLNNLSVSIKQRQLTAIRRLLFIPIRKNMIAYEDINKMTATSNSSSGQGTKKIEYYSIHAISNTQKKITVAEGITGKILAEQLKDFIYRKIDTTY